MLPKFQLEPGTCHLQSENETWGLAKAAWGCCPHAEVSVTEHNYRSTVAEWERCARRLLCLLWHTMLQFQMERGKCHLKSENETRLGKQELPELLAGAAVLILLIILCRSIGGSWLLSNPLLHQLMVLQLEEASYYCYPSNLTNPKVKLWNKTRLNGKFKWNPTRKRTKNLWKRLKNLNDDGDCKYEHVSS